MAERYPIPESPEHVEGRNQILQRNGVSIECGFSSHAHLYKVFKAKTGMTPIQWRRFMAKKASENSFIPTNETPI